MPRSSVHKQTSYIIYSICRSNVRTILKSVFQSQSLLHIGHLQSWFRQAPQHFMQALCAQGAMPQSWIGTSSKPDSWAGCGHWHNSFQKNWGMDAKSEKNGLLISESFFLNYLPRWVIAKSRTRPPHGTMRAPSNKWDRERTQRHLPEIFRKGAHAGGAVPSYEDTPQWLLQGPGLVFKREKDKSHLHPVLFEYA